MAKVYFLDLRKKYNDNILKVFDRFVEKTDGLRVLQKNSPTAIKLHVGEHGNINYKKQQARDIDAMARIIKSSASQGGWLSGAELSVLLNRSLHTIGNYLRIYHETHDDILPTKGIMLDQGSKPSHRGCIIALYEQGYPEPDIARITNHTIESTSRYLKSYKNVKLLLEKGFNLMEMVRITGLGRCTIIQYRDLVYLYHLKLKEKEKT